MALAWDVRRDGLARGKTHTGGLPLAGVWLLGPRDADLDAHALALRVMAAGQGGGDGVTGSAGFAAALGKGGMLALPFKVRGPAWWGGLVVIRVVGTTYSEDLVQCRILGWG